METNYWPPEEVLFMPNGSKRIRIQGVYSLGIRIEQLKWMLETGESRMQVTFKLRELAKVADVRWFEEIGQEAKQIAEGLESDIVAPITPFFAKALRDYLARWDTLIGERSQRLFIISPDSTILRPERLAQETQAMVPPNDYAALQSIEISDITEACRCILVNSPTAGEIMALRAAESLLRRWYQKQPAPKPIKDWGRILDELEAIYPPGPTRPKELALLDYLRRRRNEVDHPDRISNLTEAETTLMNVLQLLSAVKPYL